MSEYSYRIFQATILNKDPVNPRQYTVMQIPEGYTFVGAQLPNAMKDQSAPLIGSVVLVLQLDSYNSFILSVLREPFSFLSSDGQFRGFIPDINLDLANPIQDGEIFMEATGTGSPSGVPGTGAHLYLGNNGSAQIESGSMGEKLIIGGTGTDDDHEVVLSADSGFIESNPHEGSMIQSTYNWDNLNNLTIGNQITVVNSDTVIPLAEMTIDSLGNVELFNTTFGTGTKLASLVMDSIGNISLTGTTINLNHGTLGAARLSDTTLANPSTDPAFWEFWLNQAAIFTALPPATDPGTTEALANALKAALVALLNLFPQSITGKISSASSSVSIGN